MPALPARQLPKEILQGWLGVNLRNDGLSMADQDVMRAINADFHTQPGVIRLRAGRSHLGTCSMAAPVTLMARTGPRRYQAAGTTLDRDFVAIVTGLQAPLTTVVPARPLNDLTTWTFIANASAMRKDDGATVRVWGLVPPLTPLTVAAGGAGGLTGAYKARYTYVRVVGSSVAHQSNPSPESNTVALTAQVLSIPVVASADPQVTHIRVYRTLAGGALYLFDQQVPNTMATVTSSQADGALGTAVETDNDGPPAAGWVVEFQNHLWLCQDADNPHYLWYSKRFQPESWPPGQFVALGDPTDPLQCALPMTGLLGVFSRLTKYRVTGNTASGFVGIEALNTRGTLAPNAAIVSSQGALFVARDGLFLTNFVATDTEISQAIQALFSPSPSLTNALYSIDWSVPDALTLAEYKRRLWFGYQDTNGGRMLAIYSLDTQRWYHYQQPVHRLAVEEETDRLLMGTTIGTVAALEDTASDVGAAIALTIDFPPRAGGDRFRLKRYDFLRVEAEVPSGILSLAFSVDDVLRHTLSITGTRARGLHRLPPALLGYAWSIQATYTGVAMVKIHALEALFSVLEQA